MRNKVRSGLHNSASEVVREALRLMDDRDRVREMRVEKLRKEIQIGVDQIERGEVTPGEEVFRELRERNEGFQKTAE